MPDNDSYTTIEPCASRTSPWDGETFAVYRYSTYGESSVLAGQTKRSYIDSSTDLAQLRRDYPDAEVSEGVGYIAPEVPATPPEWFDPTIAGERWNEAE